MSNTNWQCRRRSSRRTYLTDENGVSRATVRHASYELSTYLDSEHNLSVTQTPSMKRLGCWWVGTCASSSDASPLYIHDRSNVLQWKGSSLPSSQCTSSDQCIFRKMLSDESRTGIFQRDTCNFETYGRSNLLILGCKKKLIPWPRVTLYGRVEFLSSFRCPSGQRWFTKFRRSNVRNRRRGGEWVGISFMIRR